ncbi:MAG: hypothetical protein ABJA66_15140 [Actinomycetota bacterium]
MVAWDRIELPTRRFSVGGAAALIGVLGWRWMPDETKEKLLRRAFEFKERVSQIFYRPQRSRRSLLARASAICASTAERPADYWAERGYDWYAGH